MKCYQKTIRYDHDQFPFVSLTDTGFTSNESVTVIATADLHRLLETARLACTVALGDLVAHGMPQGASTAQLLTAAIQAAEEVHAGPISDEVRDLARLRYVTEKPSDEPDNVAELERDDSTRIVVGIGEMIVPQKLVYRRSYCTHGEMIVKRNGVPIVVGDSMEAGDVISVDIPSMRTHS
jgi:hypothetical protein